jgi:hypothetical protein
MMQRTPAIVLLLCAAIASSLGAASPFTKMSGDRLMHEASNIILPARVAMFQREATKIYGSGGRDAGAEYDLDTLVRGDVYIYPVGTYGKDFNAEVRIQQNSIGRFNKNVKLISQTNFQLRQSGKPISGLRAEYQLTRPLFNSPSRRCGSQFYLFQSRPWFIAYRFSYPIEKSDVAKQHIANFLNQWHWRES